MQRDYTDPTRTIQLLDELERLGFDDEAFVALRGADLAHDGASIEGHRSYCMGIETRFEKDCANTKIQERLAWLSRKCNGKNTDSATFLRLAHDAALLFRWGE